MTFGAVRAQERAAKVLSGMLETGRIPAAMIFYGPEGTGKALLAIEFAKALLCQKRGQGPACGQCRDCQAVDKRIHTDLTVVNAHYQAALLEAEPAKQKTLRVDTIRRLRKDMEMRSLTGGWKIAVMEDAHTLELESANALLKIIEEPNPQILWILATSQRERLPRTVLSRCFSVSCAPLPAAVVAAILEERGVEPHRAAAAAELCEGSAGRALELAAGDYPESLMVGPLAPFEAADGLPREAYLARAEVEAALFALSQDIRLKHLRGARTFAQVERPLRELLRLRQALRCNADPKVVLTLAGLAAEQAAANS